VKRIAALVLVIGVCVLSIAAWSLLSPIRTDRTTARPGDPTTSCGGALTGREDDEACVDLRFTRRNEWLPRLGIGVLLVAVGAATLGALPAKRDADVPALTSLPHGR
jgi:hypothetical protein